MNKIGIKLWLGITGLVIFILVLVWFLQIAILQQVYTHKKQSSLESNGIHLQEQLKRASNISELSNLLEPNLEDLLHGNLTLTIMDHYSKQSVYTFPNRAFNRVSNFNIPSESLDLSSNKDQNYSIYIDSFSKGGRKSIIGLFPLTLQDGTTLDLIMMTPMESIKETVNVLHQQLAIITVLSLFIGSLLAWFFARYFTKPLSQIRDVSTKIALGNLDCRVDVQQKDELGELGHSINHMAEELSKIEGFRREFTANVTHELKTPIGVIQAYGELLQSVPLPEDKTKESLGIIVKESVRLNSMVEELLYLSRLQNGSVPLQLTEVSLQNLIESVVERLSLFAEQQEVTVVYPKNIGEFIVLIDDQKIFQVLYNLLHNGIKHSPPNQRVEIVTKPIEEGVLVSIKDYGSGIPEQELPYIWERFYKSDKSRKRDTSGSGLGLAIVKMILENHKLSYGVKSIEGVGSTFYLTLPISTEEKQSSL